MSRKVLLPKIIKKELGVLAGLVEEVNGAILYRRYEDFCPLEALFITGVGDIGNVNSEQERLNIVNEFFRRNPDYNFTKFHVHTPATIKKYGEHYAKNFSKGDIDSLNGYIKQNRDYTLLLATPEKILLAGDDNPELIIIDDSPEILKRRLAVKKSLEYIARNMGYK